jgi:hypothetical protein
MTIVVVTTLVLLGRHFVFVPVRVFVVAEPPRMFADPSSGVLVHVRVENRLGFAAPFHRTPLRCEFEEGQDLATLDYRDDSTTVRVRSNGHPGIVALKVITPASLFPLYVRILVEPLVADAVREATAPVHCVEAARAHPGARPDACRRVTVTRGVFHV